MNERQKYLIAFAIGAQSLISGCNHVENRTSMGKVITSDFARSLRQDEILKAVSFKDFVNQVSDGTNLVRGIYVEGKLSSPVIQQIDGNDSYVSIKQDVVTQFGFDMIPESTVGILAHDFLAGKDFEKLVIGDEASVVYGNGDVRKFLITEKLKYKATEPNDPRSNFIPLNYDTEEEEGSLISTDQLFFKVYNVSNRLVFQTCFDGNNGRLFIIAEEEILQTE